MIHKLLNINHSIDFSIEKLLKFTNRFTVESSIDHNRNLMIFQQKI